MSPLAATKVTAILRCDFYAAKVVAFACLRQEKGVQRLTFWIRRPPGGVGLPREGVVAEKFAPSLKSLSSLGLEERNLGCPGNFAGMSRTPGDVQKVCAKKSSCTFFVP